MNSNRPIPKFANLDRKTVAGFGDEWRRFSQVHLNEKQKEKMFNDYFSIFPWHLLPEGGGTGADIGCGSGRWSTLVAKRVIRLHLLDASRAALDVARANLVNQKNIYYHHSSVAAMPFPDASLDFAYSLGVLHHVPDTEDAIVSIAAKLKHGAPLLVYLYYAFDNRPFWYRWLWRLTEVGRFVIARLPYPLRYWFSQVIAATVYWPLARVGRILEIFKSMPRSWPLSYYRDKSFYVMRTDALDRFGTRLEKRFTRGQIKAMLERAGFGAIRFSENAPYWCAVGIKT